MAGETVENKINKSKAGLHFLIATVLVIGVAGLYWLGQSFFIESMEIFDVPGAVYEIEKKAEKEGGIEALAEWGLVGKPAPEFELPSVEQHSVLLKKATSDVAQSPRVLIFWATWHQGSVDQLRILNDINVAGVDILAVNLQESIEIIKTRLGLVLQDRVLFKVLADETGEVGELYDVRTLPTAFFIDGRGIVRDVFTGVLNKEMLEEKINKLIVY